MFELDTTQLEKLAVDLGKASAETVKQARAVITKTGYQVERNAKRNANRLFRPPPRGWSTGATRNSITTTIELNGLAATIGPSTVYAPFLEYGTSRQPARPFMLPALLSVQDEFMEALAEIDTGGEQ